MYFIHRIFNFKYNISIWQMSWWNVRRRFPTCALNALYIFFGHKHLESRLPTHHKFMLLFVSLWWPASCPFAQSVRYFPWWDLSSSHSSHCAPIIARLFVYVVGKCSKSKPSFSAGRWPLSCRHLSPSLLSWHTSTVAMTLLGEDQVSFTPSLPPFLYGWLDGGGIPSVQTPCNWCSRLSII